VSDATSKGTAPPHPLDQGWYVHQKDKTLGPYTGHEIKCAIEQRQILETDLVCREGGSEWVPAKNDHIIATLFQPSEPEPALAEPALAEPEPAKPALAEPDWAAKLPLRPFLLLGAGIIAVTWLIYGGTNDPNKQTANSTASDPRDKVRFAAPTEVLRFSAQEILNAYESNEVATDNRLKGHIIEISGVVQSIDKSVWDTMYVRLQTNNQFKSADMKMDAGEESKVATLRRGQSVVFRCQSMVRWVGSPTGHDCVLMSY
jgi:hypothetical protein